MASSHKTTYTYLTSLILLTFLYPSAGDFAEEISDGIQLPRTDKTTHLHFYFHDIQSGKDPSATKIAGTPNPSGFGDTFMIDDTLTEGPEMSSKLIGKAQGMYGVASKQDDPALLMVVCYEFTEGKYNGSSISVLGRNPVMHETREMPVVGGSGVFRWARGYAVAHTFWADFKTGDATVEYNVYVQHY